MAHTLTTIRDQVEINLMDTANLVWSTPILDEAIRAALMDISRAYDDVLDLQGLDGALTTTLADLDAYVLVKGAAAHALVFRVVGRYEEATPEPGITPHLAKMAEFTMGQFRRYLARIAFEQTGFIEDEYRLSWQSAENALDRAQAQALVQARHDREDALSAQEQSRLQDLQESDQSPYAQWAWEEGPGF